MHVLHTSSAKVFRFPASAGYPSRYLAFALSMPAWVPSRRLTISLTFVETACEADISVVLSYVPESVVIAAFVVVAVPSRYLAFACDAGLGAVEEVTISLTFVETACEADRSRCRMCRSPS